jgi:hypothetical protein
MASRGLTLRVTWNRRDRDLTRFMKILLNIRFWPQLSAFDRGGTGARLTHKLAGDHCPRYALSSISSTRWERRMAVGTRELYRGPMVTDGFSVVRPPPAMCLPGMNRMHRHAAN